MQMRVARKLLLLTLLCGCARGPAPAPAPAVDVSLAIGPTAATVTVKGTLQLAAAVSGTSNTSVVWSVLEAGGGAVTGAGLYTAPATVGVFHVQAQTVAAPRALATSEVTVQAAAPPPPPPPAIIVSVTPLSATVAAGGTLQLLAAVTGTTDTQVSWSVQDADAGSIGGDGVYRAPAHVATVHVLARSHADPGLSATAVVTVSAPPPRIAVAIEPVAITLHLDGRIQLHTSVSGAADQTCAFAVTEADAGSIAPDGTYTAPSHPATAHVVATSTADPTQTATATVEVIPPLALSLSPSNARMVVGGTLQLQAYLANPALPGVAFHIDHGGGTVTTDGLFTAPATKGLVTISAAANEDANVSASMIVAVVEQGVLPASIVLTPGARQQFIASYADPTIASISWNATAGLMSEGGVLTAPAAPGTYQVYAVPTQDGVNDTDHALFASVQVVPAPVPATFVEDAMGANLGIYSFFVATTIDFDSDGLVDFVVAHGNVYGGQQLFAWHNDGNGTFSDWSATVFPNPPPLEHPRHMVVADFDGDGRMDLFIADHGQDSDPFPGGQSRLFLQNAQHQLVDVTATNLLPYPERGFAHDVCIGDIDGDGHPDIYLSDIWSHGATPPGFYMNDGTGHFTKDTSRIPPAITAISPGETFTSCALVDVDGDGKLDLVLGAIGDRQQDALLLNDGTGHFVEAPRQAMPQRLIPAGVTLWIETADFNRDGYPDLLLSMTNSRYQARELQLLLNNGDGTFRDATELIPNQYSTSHAWFAWSHLADFDGAGFPGFTAANFGGSFVFGSGGAAGFHRYDTPTAGNCVEVLPIDVDKDGDMDLVEIWWGDAFQVLRNQRVP